RFAFVKSESVPVVKLFAPRDHLACWLEQSSACCVRKAPKRIAARCSRRRTAASFHPERGNVKKIPLTRGLSATVDDRDYDVLMSIGHWFAKRGKYTWYAVRKYTDRWGRRKELGMHAALLGVAGTSRVGDHIDGDGLNNTRANLRRATQSQNGANKRK